MCPVSCHASQLHGWSTWIKQKIIHPSFLIVQGKYNLVFYLTLPLLPFARTKLLGSVLALARVRVNFLPSVWYGAEFWSHAEHRFDKYRDGFVIFELGLQRAKAFSAFCTAMWTGKLEVPGRLGGDIARTGDTN